VWLFSFGSQKATVSVMKTLMVLVFMLTSFRKNLNGFLPLTFTTSEMLLDRPAETATGIDQKASNSLTFTATKMAGLYVNSLT